MIKLWVNYVAIQLIGICFWFFAFLFLGEYFDQNQESEWKKNALLFIVFMAGLYVVLLNSFVFSILKSEEPQTSKD